MTISDARIVLASFYRAGVLALRQLANLGLDKDDVRVLTHTHPRNGELLDFLEDQDYRYTTEHISSSEVKGLVADFDPDVLISLYYRHPIPSEILDVPDYGGVNIHPSLLPKYRGVLSVPWAMVNGDAQTGYTYHFMTEAIDAGPILHQSEIDITENDTAYSLYHRIIHAGMTDFVPTLQKVVNGYEGRPQQGQPSYHSRGELPNDGWIDHSRDEDFIERFIRAMHYPPFPPAKADFNGEVYEITSMAEYLELRSRLTPA